MNTRFLAAAVAAVLVIATASSACHHGEGLDVSKLPREVRADYDVFAHKCSKCHSLARPLTANISDDEQWVLYVNRMRRQPASGISSVDQEAILRFLRYYAADLRRIQAEKRASATAPSTPAQSVSAPLPPPPVPAAIVDGGGK